MNTVRILFIGDVVGIPGRIMFQKHIARLKTEYRADAVVVNGENSSAEGRGITPKIVRFFRHNHVDVVTTGNHVWKNKEIYNYWDTGATDLLRPANFPYGVPGIGCTVFTIQDRAIQVAIINMQGRVFMHEQSSCPFRAVDSLLTYLHSKTPLIFVDFHAETTSEKVGFAYHVDGRVSGVVGTHTHVPTADERICPQGTAFVTDLGMVGAQNSMLGMKKEPIIQQFLTQMPVRYAVDTVGPFVMSGVVIEANTATGKAVSIERVMVRDELIAIHERGNEVD